MKLIRTFALAALASAASAFAQHATLVADQTTIAAGGGTVALQAVVTYDGEPGAVGWQIVLPADWALVSVRGPNVPSIAPDTGTTGTLEFAYTSVPVQRAEFTVHVRYPANAASAAATPTVLVRANGKLSTLTPPAVQFSGPGGGATKSRQ